LTVTARNDELLKYSEGIKMDEILVEEYRGRILECAHRGCICGVSDGGVRYYNGDPDLTVFFRSTAKPLQAIPLVKKGLDEKYGFTGKETTIFTSSHRGEPFHTAALESIMSKIEVGEEDLICQPTYPLDRKTRETLIKSDQPQRRIYHNCSGKHLGILSLCRDAHYSLNDYWSINNPAQQEILEHISLFTGCPKDRIGIGTDGCGAPVFAAPLKCIAGAYLKLACPDLLPDQCTKKATEKITKLMNENYEMVSGTGQLCSLLLTDRNIVAKGGFKGIYCFGLKKERLGFAIKITDGSADELPFIVAAILEQIEYSNTDTLKRLYEQFSLEIRNDNNQIIGINQVNFRLKSGK
jgi:L-asparaginase II